MSDRLRIEIESHSAAHDEFVVSQPAGMVYYSGAYLSMLQTFLQAEVRVFCVYSDDNLWCIMPVVRKTCDGISVLNSLPFFGSHGGPLLDHNLADEEKVAILEALLGAVKDHCLAEGIDSVTMVTNPFQEMESNYLLENLGFEFTLKRVGQYNLLPKMETLSQEEFLASFKDARVRGSITKALRSNVEVKLSADWEDYLFLFETHKENMSSKGMPSKELSFFEYIHQNFSAANAKLFVATMDGQRIAALLNLYFNGCVEYFVPATIDGFRVNQPASLLIFESMRQAILEGNRIWNWGGSGDGTGGVYDFKKKWGAVDDRYIYMNKVFNEAIREKDPARVKSDFQYFFVYPFSS